MLRLLISLLLIISALILNSLSSPIAKFDDDIQYRLPVDVIPTNYALDLKLEEDVFETDTFSGNVSISLQVINSVNEIKLQYRKITINKLELKNNDNVIDTSYDHDSVTDILTIQTDVDLSPTENYILSISYIGSLSETSMRGFYKSSYVINGTVNYLATTQFEATEAREAFPSFDEPQFKATFDISITFPKGFNALGNTEPIKEEDVEGNLQKVTFQTTPKMSTYLIAFIISTFTCEEGNSIDGIPTSVCSRNGTQKTTELALSVAPQVLKIMADYTGYKYADSDITKLTQVAIPDFVIGAMENWGLITFRESDFLWDEDESSNIYEETVVGDVTHELSHQWFGDLVTLDWWSDIFLNEGFATYFEYHASDLIYPEWEFTKRFVIDELQVALQIDSLESSLPLSFYVDTPSDISNRFDDISYNKGGSILRMVQHFLGLENFKAGLNDYIAENKFSNGNPTILWNSFDEYAKQLPDTQKLPDTMLTVMTNWTNNSGYPLLNVESNGDDISISQEYFLLSGNSDSRKWYVPISYTLSNENVNETTTRVWLTPDETLVIPGLLSNASWIVLNNQQTGYYRINYDETLWQAISQALRKTDFDGIDVLNRAQIADDLFNLAQANKKNYSDVFDILQYLQYEKAYYPWSPAFNGFNYLLARTRDETLQITLSEYISELMEELYNSTPFSDEQPDDHVYTRAQILALTWACTLNNQDCVTNSKKLFSTYKDESIKPSRNLRSIVYCNGLRYSENITEDWEFLWSKFAETQLSTEQVTILKALACTTDEDILKEYLLKTITEESGIRIQDVKFVYSSVYSSYSTKVIDIILDFALNNHKEIVSYFNNTDTLNSLILSVSDRLTNQEQVDKLSDFIENEELDDNIKTSATGALEQAKAILELIVPLELQLKNYFGIQ